MKSKLSAALVVVLATLSALSVPATPALSATIDVGVNTSADCTFWCVNRYQEVYSASLFSGGPVTIDSVSFFADPLNGSSWNGVSTWQMIIATSTNPVGGLSSTFSANLGADQKVFDTETFSGSPSLGSLVTFSGTFSYDPSNGPLIIDIQRVSGTAQGVGLEAGYNAGLTDRAYAFSSYTTTAGSGGVNQSGYANRTEFGIVDPVPGPIVGAGLPGLLGMLGLGGWKFWRRRQKIA